MREALYVNMVEKEKKAIGAKLNSTGAKPQVQRERLLHDYAGQKNTSSDLSLLKSAVKHCKTLRRKKKTLTGLNKAPKIGT